MPPVRIAVLAGLLLALGGTLGVVYFVRQQADRAQQSAKTARFDASRAADSAAQRIGIVAAEPTKGPPSGTPAYAEATVQFNHPDGIARVLFELHGGQPESLVLAARVRSGPRELATVPLLIAGRAPGSAGTDKKEASTGTAPIVPPVRTLFTFHGGPEPKELTALFALAGDGTVTVSLEAAFPKASEAESAASEAAALAAAIGRGLPLIAPGKKDEFAIRAAQFHERYLGKADERIERLATATLSASMPAQRATFTDAKGKPAGAIVAALATRGPLIANGTLDYRRAAAITVGPERRVGPYLAGQGNLAAAIVAGSPQEAQDACRELAQALGADLGLAAVDSVRIVGALARARAPFVAAVPTGPCGASATPKQEAPAAASKIQSGMMARLSGMLRQGPPRKGQDPLGGFIGDVPALFDLSGLWLAPEDAGVLAGSTARVHPAARKSDAVEALRALPVSRMGCFGAGRGTASHQASLVELRGDKSLWHLELAYDDAGKIAAVAFDAARQEDFCRLAAPRAGSGPSCTFSGARFRGIDPKRC